MRGPPGASRCLPRGRPFTRPRRRRGRSDEDFVHAVAVHVDDLESASLPVEPLALGGDMGELGHDKTGEGLILPSLLWRELMPPSLSFSALMS